jgi:hypothetical protein
VIDCLICLKVLEMYSYFLYYMIQNKSDIIFPQLMTLLIWTQQSGRRSRDHMVVGFITTYAISAYYH